MGWNGLGDAELVYGMLERERGTKFAMMMGGGLDFH